MKSKPFIPETTELPRRRFIVSVHWQPERILEKVPAMLGPFTGLVDAAGTGRSGVVVEARPSGDQNQLPQA